MINWDAVGGVTQIVTIAYLIYQFHYLPNKQRKDALSHLKVLFLLSRSKAQKLIDSLTLYYIENDCEDNEFLPGVTFKSQLLQLHHLMLNDLNDDVLNGILKQASTDYLLATAANSISKQIDSFTQLEAHFNTVFTFKEI